MLTYKLSLREKVLMGLLAVAVVVVAWYMLVFQGTTDEIRKIDNEIGQVQTDIGTATVKTKKMNDMLVAIDGYKADGAEPRPVPEFDNSAMLMAELNSLMSSAAWYTVTFDDPDYSESSEYVLRSASISFGSNSVAEAEATVLALENSKYPCRIDDFSITDSSTTSKIRSSSAGMSAPVSAKVDVTFFEKQNSLSKDKATEEKKDGGTANPKKK